MKPDSKQQNLELQSFKSLALWLLAYKLFRDYLELIRFGQRPELEKFFEVWVARCMPTDAEYTQKDKSDIWKLLLGLLFARAEQI